MVYLMETQTLWISLHRFLLFLCISSITEGWTCEAPSSPQCFRQNSQTSVYICEWSSSNSAKDETFSLHTKFTCETSKNGVQGSFVHFYNCSTILKTNIKQPWIELVEEELMTSRPVDIWVESHQGNSSCTSPSRSVQLGQIVKFEAPQNISVSWGENNLTLTWPAAESFPAVIEIWIQRHNTTTEPWETNFTAHSKVVDSAYQVSVANISKNSSYHVKIRHRSNRVKNPLWSKWSPVVTVPAELRHEPEVTTDVQLISGTRKLTLKWKAMPPEASVQGVTYKIFYSQSFHGCPCGRRVHSTNATKYAVYLSHSAVNVSVIAQNVAGESPPAVVQVPLEPLPKFKICDKTMLDEKVKDKTCLEWFEIQDVTTGPQNSTILSGRDRKKEKVNKRKTVQDYIRYLYLEHRCNNRKPATVKKCLFYQREGVPNKAPLDFIAISETHTSVNLSWSEIPIEHQRGFLTQYKLCTVRSSSQEEVKECFNVSRSVTKFNLQNLIPGTKYNISLSCMTRVGEGPEATVIINTEPEKPMTVWLSFGLLVVFFLFSVSCTFILKRVRNKIFPTVPTPIIPDFPPGQPENQEMLIAQEEFDPVTLLQTQDRAFPIDESEGISLRSHGSGECIDNEKRDSERLGNGCSSKGSTDEDVRSPEKGAITHTERMDHELSMLIYRNGLVFCEDRFSLTNL